jgi:hypothetical protein
MRDGSGAGDGFCGDAAHEPRTAMFRNPTRAKTSLRALGELAADAVQVTASLRGEGVAAHVQGENSAAE